MKRPLLILPDQFSARTVVSCGILRGLWEGLAGHIDNVFLFDLERSRTDGAFDLEMWGEQSRGIRVCMPRDLWNTGPGPSIQNRIKAGWDNWLDERYGYFSLAMRLNLRHGFMVERMKPGHFNPFLNTRRGWPFPRSRRLYRFLSDWYFGPARHLCPGMVDYMKAHTSVLVTSNLQYRSSQPYLIAARRLGIPVIGNIASWDHPVGKGVVYPEARRYLVQNTYMSWALKEVHDIEPGRIAITGWPQTDIYARPRPRSDYEVLLRTMGLDPRKPSVLVTGNTENNYPREPYFVERLFGHLETLPIDRRPVMIFRPHPRDWRWKTRYASLIGRSGAHVQRASYSDTEDLAVLLRHVNCVVTNAGTILLDSLVNDRPVVCVIYDEGSDGAAGRAELNITGHHYRDLVKSGAFIMARNFDEVAAGVSRSLGNPDELSPQRRSIVEQTVGVMDGRAGERVAQEILDACRNQHNAGAAV